MMVETYLRRGQRHLEHLSLNPKLRSAAMMVLCAGSGLLFSAVGLGSRPQPVVMGLICSAIGWKALLMALITPDLTELQNSDNWTELMVIQEEMKTMPFGEIWAEYCRVCGAPADGQWFCQGKQYENEVLSKRG